MFFLRLYSVPNGTMGLSGLIMVQNNTSPVRDPTSVAKNVLARCFPVPLGTAYTQVLLKNPNVIFYKDKD